LTVSRTLFPAPLSDSDVRKVTEENFLKRKSPVMNEGFKSSQRVARDSASAAEVVACGVLSDRGIVSRLGRAARVGDTRDKVRVSHRPGPESGRWCPFSSLAAEHDPPRVLTEQS
jgi:hypothetical protein